MSNDELPVSAIQRRIAKQLMLSDDFAALILRWFGDTAVGLDISDDERSWIAGLLDTGGHRELLMPIAKRMAIHFLQEPHFIPLIKDAFQFINDFLTKVGAILISLKRLLGILANMTYSSNPATNWMEQALWAKLKRLNCGARDY
jgi:hypothetical protein